MSRFGMRDVFGVLALAALLVVAAPGGDEGGEAGQGADSVAVATDTTQATSGPAAPMDTTPAGTPAPPAKATAAEAERGTVTVRLFEYRIEMQPAVVPAGNVTFNVMNAGGQPHALEVEGGGVEHETQTLQPGTSTTLSVDLKPGVYEVYCPVRMNGQRHKDLGMETTLRVTG